MLFLLFLPFVSSLRGPLRHHQSVHNMTTTTRNPFLEEDNYVDDLYFARDPEGPHIVRHSTFSQRFKLGYKLLLVCEAEGRPRPAIVWYKNGAELNRYRTIHIKEKILSPTRFRSKLEIDPTSMADQGIYGCLANNPHGYHLKSMKVDYHY